MTSYWYCTRGGDRKYALPGLLSNVLHLVIAWSGVLDWETDEAPLPWRCDKKGNALHQTWCWAASSTGPSCGVASSARTEVEASLRKQELKVHNRSHANMSQADDKQDVLAKNNPQPTEYLGPQRRHWSYPAGSMSSVSHSVTFGWPDSVSPR